MSIDRAHLLEKIITKALSYGIFVLFPNSLVILFMIIMGIVINIVIVQNESKKSRSI